MINAALSLDIDIGMYSIILSIDAVQPVQKIILLIASMSITRFTNAEDKVWFENALKNICRTQIGEDYFSHLPEEPFFVDFLREAPEPTGDEGDDANLEAPKIYEMVHWR